VWINPRLVGYLDFYIRRVTRTQLKSTNRKRHRFVSLN